MPTPNPTKPAKDANAPQGPHAAPASIMRSGGDPEREAIRRRAYQLYEERAGGPGDAESDWRRAEQELRRSPTT